MAAINYNIENLEQGATFDNTVMPPIAMKSADGLAVFDLTGWTVRAQIRKKHTDTNPVSTFTSAVDLPTGVIQLSLTATQTAAIPAGNYLYDMEVEKATVVRRVISGTVSVSPEVTK